MKVLVTGPGRLGARLLPRLEHLGVTGKVLHRRAAADPSPAWRALRADIADPVSLRGAADGCDVVLHLAALTHSNSRSAYERVNAEGTGNLLAEARRAGVRHFVHVSTRAIDPRGGAYSRSKARAEERVRNGGIPWTILRPAEVYGTGGEGVDELIARVRRGGRVPIVGDGSARLAPVYVDDVIEAIAAAVLAPPAGRTLVLAGPEELTYAELVARLAAHFGTRPRPLRVPATLLRAVAWGAALLRLPHPPLYIDQVSRLLSPKPWDVAAAGEALAFHPRPLAAGLQAMESGLG